MGFRISLPRYQFSSRQSGFLSLPYSVFREIHVSFKPANVQFMYITVHSINSPYHPSIIQCTVECTENVQYGSMSDSFFRVFGVGVREQTVDSTTNDERRTTNDERRTTNDERRTTNEERRTTNDERRTTNDERRTTTTTTTMDGGRRATMNCVERWRWLWGCPVSK